MTEQEAFLAIRNAIRLENLSRRVAGKITRDVIDVFKEIGGLIQRLPTGTVERELYVRQLLRQVAPLLKGPNDKLYTVLSQALREEAVEQVYHAEAFLKVADANRDLDIGLTVNPGTGQTFTQSAVTRTQLIAIADDTKVLNKTMVEMFGMDGSASEFIKSNMKHIDRVVKRGFLLGETNEQIAQNMRAARNLTLRDSRAIARTAVMDMSQRANNRFWDANSDRIKMWEYDATFDYRVCPLCYPNDGLRKKDRGDLPAVPVHPNCRCRHLPLTSTALALEKEEMEKGMEMSTVQIGSPQRGGGSKVRPYKTPVKFQGKKTKKFARDYKVPRGERPTMGFFLLRANNETRKAVLGAGNAKRFAQLIKGTPGSRSKLSAEDALIEIIKNPKVD